MKKWFPVVLIALSACSPKVVSFVNEKAGFHQFETYRLVSAKSEPKNFTPENTQIFDLIRENIHTQMQRRGYEKSSITPDLTLRYEVTSNTRVEINNNTQFNPYYNPYYPAFPVTSRTIYESVLLLELFDNNNKLVWQGSYDLRQERKEKRIVKAIERAVGYIFTSYPYRARSAEVDESLKTIEK